MPHTLRTYNGITNAMVASQSGYHAASLRRAQGKLWLSTGIIASFNQTLGGVNGLISTIYNISITLLSIKMLAAGLLAYILINQ